MTGRSPGQFIFSTLRAGVRRASGPERYVFREMFRSEHIVDLQVYVQSVPTGTYPQFYRNTVEIAENSENHLKAIVGERQVAVGVGLSEWALKVVRKTQGEEKAPDDAFSHGGTHPAR
jgi:hypothetical protein